jgi:hypothetical protein
MLVESATGCRGASDWGNEREEGGVGWGGVGVGGKIPNVFGKKDKVELPARSLSVFQIFLDNPKVHFSNNGA